MRNNFVVWITWISVGTFEYIIMFRYLKFIEICIIGNANQDQLFVYLVE